MAGRWECARILTTEDDESKTVEGPPGAGGQRIWVFAAKAEGQCELRFESARVWEKRATGRVVTFPVVVVKGG